ncbi:SDR family NAD(P)-dependent oxidoreductase [Streptomyces sp. CBMA123]|uniref:SDR family NAD(P)-dependent oxidoreductase n=1 Tax=Streptomyces sp. CBMA123 TaxID=1896313 RepID=UPI001661F0BF|nr:SDR family NAD(P)-dependent oxidoreductase [Streptomyces sp. CBMA123]MBD0692956.1 short-chain dehydrogenase [Streptomyces sp. CBMA123]
MSSSAPQSPPWDVHRLPRAEGKAVLVTGGNAGIGYFVAEQLAGTGATVVLGSRDRRKAEAAMASIGARVPGARLRHLPLDLADPASVEASAEAIGLERLDAVVHNAGIALDDPPRRRSADGHELMFATNHLGHFALTARLAPLLAATPGSRIVTTGSFAAKSERLDFTDLQSARDYRPKRAYARSKLAQMLFAVELDRRLRAAGSRTLSVLVHPGGALDALTPARPPLHARTTGERLGHLPLGLVVQGKDAAAWPAVRAVLDPGVRGGPVLWSPRVFGLRGEPRPEPLWEHLADPVTAAWLWEASCELTGHEPVFSAAAGSGYSDLSLR